jgi:hypothetical protein
MYLGRNKMQTLNRLSTCGLLKLKDELCCAHSRIQICMEMPTSSPNTKTTRYSWYLFVFVYRVNMQVKKAHILLPDKEFASLCSKTMILSNFQLPNMKKWHDKVFSRGSKF